MDGYDWVNWIDEYHCTDYWNEDYFPEQDDFLDDDDDSSLLEVL